jgi:GMP synthase (glutamine-hydrolysing)
MDILIIQNDPIAPAGIVEERIVARGAAPVVIYPHEGDPVPADADDFIGAVVLGGAMSAMDEVGYPAIPPILELLRDFHAKDRPLLGLCLGAQLLARSFDKPVRRHTALELGFAPIEITEQGADDPLLAGLPRRQRIMQWHEDTFEMPDAAVPLMTGAACRNQAFRIGRATYGFQGHFEATPRLVEAWINGFGHSLPAHLGEEAPAAVDRVRQEVEDHAEDARAFAEAVSDRWLDLAIPPGR